MLLYRHVYRIDSPLNADPEKIHQNIYNIHQLNDEGSQMSYMDSFRRRISQLPYYQDHKIRSKAVLGIDVLFSYSKRAEGTFDKQAWMEKNAKWLNDTFSVAPDGRSNVISVVYHEDKHSFHGKLTHFRLPKERTSRSFRLFLISRNYLSSHPLPQSINPIDAFIYCCHLFLYNSANIQNCLLPSLSQRSISFTHSCNIINLRRNNFIPRLKQSLTPIAVSFLRLQACDFLTPIAVSFFTHRATFSNTYSSKFFTSTGM